MDSSSRHHWRASSSTANSDSSRTADNPVSFDEQHVGPIFYNHADASKDKSFLPTPDSTQVFDKLSVGHVRSQVNQPSNDQENNTAVSLLANTAKPYDGSIDHAIAISTSNIFGSRIFELREAFKEFGGPWGSNGELVDGSKIDLEYDEVLTWVTTENDRRQAWIRSLNPMFSVAKKSGRPTRPPWKLSSRPFMGQISILRLEFSHDSTPSSENINRLAHELGISKPEVDYWFKGEREIQCSCWAEGELIRERQEAPSITVSDFTDFQSTQSMGSMYSTNPDYLGYYPETVPALNSSINLPEVSAPEIKSQNAGLEISAMSRNLKRPTASCYDGNHSLAPLQRQSKRPRRDLAPGPFKCLFGDCGKSCKTLDRWRSHQTSYHFLRYVYICRENQCQQIPIRKKGNFEKHLKDHHNYEPGIRLKEKVKSCAINTMRVYHDICGFCRQPLHSREDSLTHIRDHLNDGHVAEQWEHLCKSDHSLESYVRKFLLGTCRPYKLGKRDFYDDEDEEDDDSDNDIDETQNDDHSLISKKSTSLRRGTGSTNSKTSSSAPESREQSSSQDFTFYLQGSKHRNDIYPPQFSTPISNSTSLPLRFKPRNLVFEHVRYLGRGTFGTIDEVFCKLFIETFARKTIRPKSETHKSSESFRQFKNELKMMKLLARVKNSHFTRILTYFVRRDRFEIIMSPVADGTLSRFLLNGSSDLVYPEHNQIFLKWMLCLISAVACLHQEQIGHGDLKPANVLIRHGKVFVADFGSAKTISDAAITSVTRRPVFTPMYCAPEIISHRPHSLSTDIFSLGCIYAELATRFQNKSLQEFARYRGLGSSNVSYYLSVQRTDQWLNYLSSSGGMGISESCTITKNMLREEPTARPLAGQVLSEMRRLVRFGCCARRTHSIPQLNGKQGRRPTSSKSKQADRQNRKPANTLRRWTEATDEKSNSSSLKLLQCLAFFSGLSSPGIQLLGSHSTGFSVLSCEVSYWRSVCVLQEVFIGANPSTARCFSSSNLKNNVAHLDIPVKDGTLLDAHAALNMKIQSEKVTLIWASAAKLRLAARVQPLLEPGADVDSETIWIAGYFSYAVTQQPLEYGADVDSKRDSGETALSLAAQNGQDEVVELLLKCSIDVDSHRDSEKTALLLAADRGYEALARQELQGHYDRLRPAPIHCSQSSSPKGQKTDTIASIRFTFECERDSVCFRRCFESYSTGRRWLYLDRCLTSFSERYEDSEIFSRIRAHIWSETLFTSAANTPYMYMILGFNPAHESRTGSYRLELV